MVAQVVNAAPILFSRWTPGFSSHRRQYSLKPTQFTVVVVAQQSSSNGRPELHAPPTPPTVQRRSGNYGPDIWESHEYAKPTTHNTPCLWGDRVEELKKYVKQKLLMMMSSIGSEEDGGGEEMATEMIGTLQRLGVGYHFEAEIQNALRRINNVANPPIRNNLHACALRFRLLRQAGIWVSAGSRR